MATDTRDPGWHYWVPVKCVPVHPATQAGHSLQTSFQQPSTCLLWVARGGHFLEAASKDKQFPVLTSCPWLPEVTCWKCQKGHAHLLLKNCEQEHKDHYREVKFMTNVHLAHPPGLTPLPPWSTGMTLPCTHSLLTQSWLWKGRSNSISSLSSCGNPRTVLSGPYLLPATSRLPGLAMELSWPYWYLRHAASPADGGRIWKVRKWPKSH